VNPLSDRVLRDQWQEANDFRKTLQKEEAGHADNPPIQQLDMSEYEPLLIEFLNDPLVRDGFNTVPTEVAIVELDRLVVYQHHIDLSYVKQLEQALPDSLTPEQIFRTCLLHDHPQPVVNWSRLHRDSFVFMSRSNDLRFLGALKLRAKDIKKHNSHGNLSAVIGLAVGFGSNFMNAIKIENRLILNNGSHRAYALRKMGITHVPCIIQHVSSREDLDITASSQVLNHRKYYLKDPRPPMLKDYFNPKLHTVVPVQRRIRQITVKFQIDESYVPAV
jgi:hypothetical protein